jgi:hypothetical protein
MSYLSVSVFSSCHLESDPQPFYLHKFTIMQWYRFSISVLMVMFAVLHVVATELQSRHDDHSINTSSSIQAESYFREPTASSLLYAHSINVTGMDMCSSNLFVTLLSLFFSRSALICEGLNLDIASSNLSYPAQILFLGLHAVGVIIGLAYNSKTPDLYPNSAHRKLD